MKYLVNFFTIIYFIIAIILTTFLLSYNEYKVTEIGDYVFLLSTDEELEEISQKGDLIIVKKASNKKINEKDKIFFYKKEKDEMIISAAEVIEKREAYREGYNYVVEGDYIVSDSRVIGKVEECKKIHHLGTILSILESRLVFLFIIVLPTFIIFLYELYKVVMEIKYGAFEDME